MAPLPELKSPVAAAIEAHYRDVQTPQDDECIRCSKIGEECERSLWYSFRWTMPLERHEGRLERLFDTGRREEARMVADLRAIGVTVRDLDPETGEQWRVSFLNGILRGSADGRGIGIPGAEKTEHLLEFKTMNAKSFQDWRRKGVAESKPVYYAQCQIYMLGLNLTRALFMAKNKDTEEIETERVHLDALAASALIVKAERIAYANRPPPKVESFACRWCKHEKVCRYSDWARAHCRTCLHSDLGEDGQWRCTTTGAVLTIEQQKAGCGAHRYIPELVPGEQTDVAGDIVIYRLHLNGEDWADGVDPKPAAPEVRP